MICQFVKTTRGGIFAALCFMLLVYSDVYAQDQVDVEPFITSAILDQLPSDNTWHALLHSDGLLSRIPDKDFLLSSDNFTPENEMWDTLRFLYAGDPDNVCRFPARYFWLKSKLGLPDLPLDSCKEVAEFRTKAPISEISLGFASENLTHPESMMGHAFLKLTGYNSENNEISYAVSFYTDAGTKNIPKLFAESMITGKQGFFALISYSEKLKEYVEEEQRKLWIYRLDFTPQQRELVQLHLLELKNAKMKYFFHNYNCATVIDYILGLSGRKNRHNILWSTPKGVVKNAHEMGLVSGTEVIPPSRWLVRELQGQLSSSEIAQIRNNSSSKKNDFLMQLAIGEHDFVRMELASAYNQYLYGQGKITEDILSNRVQAIKRIRKEKFNNFALKSANKDNPGNAPDDSQIALTVYNNGGKYSAGLSFLPVSHLLIDDNRSYGIETELQMLGVSIKVPSQENKLMLNQLNLYSVQTIFPRDALTGGLSSRFYIGYQPQYNNLLESHHAAVVSGAGGVAFRFVADMDFYMFLGGGVGYTQKNKGYLYGVAETGMIVREIMDMKSIISLSNTAGQGGFDSDFSTIRLQQAKYMSGGYSVVFDWTRLVNNTGKIDNLEFSVKKVF